MPWPYILSWRRRILRDVTRDPPPSLSAAKVIKFLESLDIKVIEQAGSAELVFAKEATGYPIAGWGARLESQQLQRIMDFLRSRAGAIPFLASERIPQRREIQHA